MKRILPTIALLMVAILVACVGGKSASDPIATARAMATYVGSGQHSPAVASATQTSPPPSPTATSSPANTPTQTAEEGLYLLYFYADW